MCDTLLLLLIELCSPFVSICSDLTGEIEIDEDFATVPLIADGLLTAAPPLFLILRRRNVRFAFVRSILIPACDRMDNWPSEAVSVIARNMSNDFFGTATLVNRVRLLKITILNHYYH